MANDELMTLEFDILYPQTQRFEQPEARTVQETANDPVGVGRKTGGAMR